MQTRAEARREREGAEGRHAALLSVVQQLAVELGPRFAEREAEVEAALAAIGEPGSAPLLAALAHDGHALLRAACRQWPTDAAAPLLRAYGEAPDALAGMARALEAQNFPMWRLANSGHACAVAALLGAYQRAGRAEKALAADGHRALLAACAFNGGGSLEILRLMLDEYGEPGCDAVLAALAVRDHGALRFACSHGRAPAVVLLAAAYGLPGCSALREVLVEGPLLRDIFFDMTFRHHQPEAVTRWDPTLAALLAALGEADCATALRAVSGWLETPKSHLSNHLGIRLCEPAERLARITPGSLLARLAVATPAAWAVNPDAARALLSAPVRASVALPVLLALRRLPAGVAEPVAAHLRARPWLLFSGAAAAALARAQPPA
jgi:hypothetical protein